MVAGNHLHRNTSGAAFGDRSLGLFTWRIDEAHQAEKHDAIAEIIERDACLGRGQPSHCKTPQALAMIRSPRSEEHTSELQSLMRISYAVFCLKQKHIKYHTTKTSQQLQLHTTHPHINI